MLEVVGYPSLEALIKATVPESIRHVQPVQLDAPLSESEALNKLKGIISKNVVNKSFIGAGYYETLTPGVILRNVSYRLLFLHSLSHYYRSLRTLAGTLPILHIKLKFLKADFNPC